MNLKTVFRKVKEKGLIACMKYAFRKIFKKNTDSDIDVKVNSFPGKTYKVLLLTNRDSDNVGDQVIEATDIGLIGAVSANLKKNIEIQSRAASIVSQAYFSSKNPEHLKAAETAIKDSDVVIFGGAPMFNFLYQNFYERTAVTLELCQKYNKPVLFSAVGVEDYSDTNEKCQRLKKTLNFDCVKQITTRDGIGYLEQYKENENLVIDKVSDPAVFSDAVFSKYTKKKSSKKKIGIFIMRAGAFVDNKIPFTRLEAANFWVELIKEIESRGYDYECLTSGHCSDEAFMDYLIREYHLKASKCIFNMNTPEQLASRISSYDAIVSCRLHPSIIAFSLKVPSLGIVWNNKVSGFYDSIGYPQRIVTTDNISAKNVTDRLEVIMKEGVQKDEAFLMSVYTTLFNGIKRSLNITEQIEAFSYQQLTAAIVPHQGTSAKEKDEKIKRKFRRIYSVYNQKFDKNEKFKEEIKKLKAENKELKARLENQNQE